MTTPTFHLQLLQAVLATQQALQSVPTAHVSLERIAPLDAGDVPAIVINPGMTRFESFGSDGDWDILKARMEIVLSHHSRGDAQTALADPCMAESHTALMADPSLGGLAQRLALLTSRPRKASADGTAGVYDLTYEATVLVSEKDLRIWSQ